MRIVLADNIHMAVETVVSMVLDKIQRNPASVIGLATGRTMEPVYAEISKSSVDFSKCFFFMLDEYVGLPENHPSSFKAYVQNHVARPLDLSDSQFAFHPVHSDLKSAASHYETSLKESGGIDLQLLGIGQNGHIGFNEPGSDKNTRTRVVELTQETREANQGQFGNEVMPTQALSMGIATILESKEIVLLATGKSKASAIKYLLNHHDDPSCPATYLKSHPHFTLVLDPEAASKINLNI